MVKFYYKLSFSPYTNVMHAKNYKDAWQKLKKMWPEYDVKKVISLTRWR